MFINSKSAELLRFFTLSVRFLVIAPYLCKYLSKYKIVEFFPMNALEYLSNVTKQIIEKRKTKQEVNVYLCFHLKIETI